MASLQPGDAIEVFYRMPCSEDNGHERLEIAGDRWMLCPTSVQGCNRPRIGWTERWLPATLVEAPVASFSPLQEASARFRWELRLWYDWASGDHIDVTTDPKALIDVAKASRVRARSLASWSIPCAPSWCSSPNLPRSGSELAAGGVQVSVSFIVFRWGAARIPIEYDAHSWGAQEGSTISNRFVNLFFSEAVQPRLGCDYEVLSVFVQHSDEFASISHEFIASICRGSTVCALYFLWPLKGQQN
eukprot:TRINITY_DN44257_c0_g1_i1.p1 TRINITY_DN44257_c0_g1~~TRINITY_DN44257_c0_g1_i1.p1  ORF type:complete len:245 (+),score=45.13 TRINITY_DN44257_c0_g1_i1:131-865(+)